jgi:ABC-type transporter Mla subunit MlaD
MRPGLFPKARRFPAGAVPALAMAVLSCAWLACGPPPPQVHVTWDEPVDLVVGSPVNYQGLRIGTVSRVALQQPDPEGPARVTVTISVEEPDVTLRRSDRFHLSSSGGVAAVEVRPWQAPSEPLPDGAVVAGVPPLMSRVEDQVDEVLESLGTAALEAIDAAIDALEGVEIEVEGVEGEVERAEGDSADEAGGAPPDTGASPESRAGAASPGGEQAP